MQASLALETRALALDVHTLLSELDVARWRAELEHAARSKVASIERRLLAVRGMDGLGEEPLTPVRSSVDEVAAVLRAHVPGADLDTEQLRDEWAAFRARLQPAYESMANALRAQAIHVPTRRPTNYARNVLHAGGAVATIALVHFLLPTTWLVWIGCALACWAWSMELGRRLSPRVNKLLMAILGSFAHPHEAYRVNSATWYCTALLILGLTGSKTLLLVAIAVLGFADPAAAIIGRRWGSIKLVNGRSLQGTGAFMAVGTIVAALVLLLTRPDLAPLLVLGMGASAAVLSGLAELFSLRVDDNLSVPVAAAAGAGLIATLLGVAL